MRGWVKWGVGFAIVGFIFYVIYFLVGASILISPAAQIFKLLFWHPGPEARIPMLIFQLIGYFLLGAIIGWIIGRIKSKA